jgi:hypothetical protein
MEGEGRKGVERGCGVERRRWFVGSAVISVAVAIVLRLLSG